MHQARPRLALRLALGAAVVLGVTLPGSAGAQGTAFGGGEAGGSAATSPPLDLAALPAGAFQPIAPVTADGVPLADVLRALGDGAGVAVVVGPGLDRPVTAALPTLSFLDALTALAHQERLVVRQDGATLYVEADAAEAAGAGPSPLEVGGGTDVPVAGGGLRSVAPPGVTVRGGTVSINVEDAPLSDLLRTLARDAGLVLVAPNAPESRVTARLENVPLEDALRILLTGTALTFRREGAALVVGDRQLPAMLTSRLVALRHIPAGGLLERIPDALRQQGAYQLVPEQNALLVTGPADVVAATEAFLRELDHPTDQILLEVLVVEFETSGLRRLGVSFLGGLNPTDGAPEDEAGSGLAYLFGGGNDQRGGLDMTGDGTAAGRFLNFWSDLLGIRSIGRLPSDFYFRLQALEHAGNAEIRSRPQIATLNGHPASISVGTSQYYILRSTLPYGYGGGSDMFGQGAEVERFEYVQADVRLEITPWVAADGGITALIRPSFTTPIGGFDPRIPPALHNWSVDTSVRLRDGETFMIGGLIQERERVSENRVPLLGRLPLIGRLFRNTERERRTSELVIFITPHVFGDGVRPPGTEGAYERVAPPEQAPAGAERAW